MKLHHARWQWLARLLFGLIVIVLLTRYQAPQAQHVLQAVSPPVIIYAVLCYWALQTLSALKWQCLLRAQGVAMPLVDCCQLYLTGMFCNLWMPTSIGGDAMRIYLVAPRCGGKAKAAASVLVERLTGLAALLIIGCIGLTLQLSAPTQAHSVRSGLRLILTASLIFLLFISTLLMLRNRAYQVQQDVPALWHKGASLQQSLDLYTQPENRATLLLAFALSLLFQAGLVVLNLGLADAMGLRVPALLFCWLVPLLALASLLPFGIGGLGVREATALALLPSVPLR